MTKSSVGDEQPKEIGVAEKLQPLTREMEKWVEKACDTTLPLNWRQEAIYKVIGAAEEVKKEISKHVK